MPPPPPARPSWCPSNATLKPHHRLFFNESCLANDYDNIDWSAAGFPCPVQGTSDYMDTLTAGWRVESQVATLWSVVILAALMQLGGIPAPIKGQKIAYFAWGVWMIIQTMQFLFIFLSLVFVIVSYVRMSNVVGYCMTPGLGGFSLLGNVAAISLAFQPIILSKLLVMLLYYYAVTAGFQAFLMTHTEPGAKRADTAIGRVEKWLERGHYLIFAPIFALFSAAAVLGTPLFFGLAFYLPITLCNWFIWMGGSALLQGLVKLLKRAQQRVPENSSAQDRRGKFLNLLHGQLEQAKVAMWFLEAVPFPSKRFFDGLGLLHLYDGFRERRYGIPPPDARRSSFKFFESVLLRVCVSARAVCC